MQKCNRVFAQVVIGRHACVRFDHDTGKLAENRFDEFTRVMVVLQFIKRFKEILYASNIAAHHVANDIARVAMPPLLDARDIVFEFGDKNTANRARVCV